MFPSTYGYRPYIHSSYHHNAPAFYGYTPLCRPTYRDLEALAARHTRRAQYLPHEDAIDSDEENFYGLPNQREKTNEGDVSEIMQRYQNSRATSQQGPSIADQNLPSHVSPSQSTQHRSIPTRATPTHAPGSPHREPTPASPEPQTPPEPSHIPTLPVVEYTQVHVAAAEKIQKKYRQHWAFKAIDGVASQFEDAKNTFRFPDEIDFVDPERPGEVVTVSTVPVNEEEDTREVDTVAGTTLNGTEASGTTAISAMNDSAEAQAFAPEASQPSEATVPSANADAEDGGVEAPSSDETSDISSLSNHPELHAEPLESADSAPTAQLAYTKLNHPLHGYTEKLNVLLLKLDGVESFGSKQVRERRKEVVKAVEREVTRVENLWQDAWKRIRARVAL